MRYLLKYGESINRYYLVDLIDIGFSVNSESSERLSLVREVIYGGGFDGNIKEIGSVFKDISHFLNIKTCYEGRWNIIIYNLNIDGNYTDYYFNNALKKDDYILPDFVSNILETSIDTAIRTMYNNKIDSLAEFRIDCRPKGNGDRFKVDEVVQFIFNKKEV